MNLSRRRFTVLSLVAICSPGPDAALAATPPASPAASEPVVTLVIAVSPPDGGEPDEALAKATLAELQRRAETLAPSKNRVELDSALNIVIQLSGIDDVDMAITALTSRGLVELIDPRGLFLESGAIVATSFGGSPWPNPLGTPVAIADSTVYQTIVSSLDFSSISLEQTSYGETVIRFQLDPIGQSRLSDYSSAHIGQPMSVVLDNRVLISPIIQDVISKDGIIAGLTEPEVKSLVVQLSSKPLPARVTIESIDIDTPG